MKQFLLLFIGVFYFNLLLGQGESILIRGKLLYRNNNVVAANVVNNTAQYNTITNGDGEFEIYVRLNDELIFSSVQYKIKSVVISERDIKNKRIVVEVNERVNFLDEVVIGPENQEKFLDLKKEEFKRVDYISDKSTKLENHLIKKGELVNGINFVNIAKLIVKNISDKSENKKKLILASDILPYIFENSFFIHDIGIPEGRVVEFLKFIDESLPSQRLLNKDQEFQLIDFLIQKGESFKREINF